MAAALPGSHTYISPVARDHAKVFNGDVRGMVHQGDTVNHYHGR
jgi:hypothetical protein